MAAPAPLCPACGRPLRAGARFCTACGTTAPAPPPAPSSSP
ncbi:MAG: zinc-ribbon domain-containing protein, partial [Chloroflexi bacterium CFX7]|nr:zinc-ribbon domain-containing protein [Chloroflexi bacterium CFX7]